MRVGPISLPSGSVSSVQLNINGECRVLVGNNNKNVGVLISRVILETEFIVNAKDNIGLLLSYYTQYYNQYSIWFCYAEILVKNMV